MFSGRMDASRTAMIALVFFGSMSPSAASFAPLCVSVFTIRLSTSAAYCCVLFGGSTNRTAEAVSAALP